MKTCKTCSKEFEIRPEDTIFYEQVKTVQPLFCPECRMAQRLMFRNERVLYKRPCDLCKKDMVTLYSPESPYVVYCSKCWWSDEWNPKDFAMDYDPSKKFFDQYRELQSKVPRLGLVAIQNVRSDYTNGSAENKDCYLVFAADYNEECLYGRLLQRDKQCVDCAFLHESELCYECIDCRECFKCMFSEQCQSSTDLLFCYNLRNSNNCIFCTNGRNLSNAILNVQYSKEEFEKKKAEILKDYESIEIAKKEFEILKKKAVRKFTMQTKCHNVTGDYIHNCYDGVELFDTYDAKNCSYMKDCEKPLDSMDCNNYYYNPQRGYNIMGALEGSMMKNSAFVFYCNEVEYCDNCHHLSNAIGCISIRKGDYMILNKAYSKEEYADIKEKIEKQLQEDNLLGQFFPPDVAPFAYNESLIQDFYPLSREVALRRGYRWQEHNTGTFGKETMTEENIPKTISAVSDSILSEILACNECGKNFRLTEMELSFYRRMGIPVPHKDFECRHQDRMKKRNGMKLWHRSCMCVEDKHDHEGKCSNEFETTYAPERSEQIYCEPCYQREVA
jgi:hypothetical protein